ncbi:MAG: alkaline phosphatase D family protein [Bdellovibrionales bacterium]|nr:alkaline phosphatase D family protein [Ramlibacter sp.]
MKTRDAEPALAAATLLEAPSRRSFIRSAVVYAMAVSSGLSMTACGGGTTGPVSGPFQHGVASGDPLQDRVILWTRVTAAAPGAMQVSWELAADANFGVMLATGTATTSAAQDYTVKVDATGLLPGAVYFYRFNFGGERSPTGRTKTLPAGGALQAKMAVFSCSSFSAGYFNAFADAAKRTDLDLVLHLGDFIYEYGVIGFAAQLAIAFDREAEPSHETVTLDDYRRRHRQMRTDSDLRDLNAAVPMIAVWDDHDIANNAWSGGAGAHDPNTEGSWVARRSAAIQAWQEWVPIRLPEPANPLKIYRSFNFGNLASLHMLDTRLIGRDQQLSLNDYNAGRVQDPARQLLGTEQTNWLTAQMQASTATWQVLGQQVLMAHMEIPESIASALSLDSLFEYLDARATQPSNRTQRQNELMAQRSAPYNFDAWDGYPAAREAVLAAARAQDKNLISLAGDTHNAWASDLLDASGNRVGVEFATASVTSPGFELTQPLILRGILQDAFLSFVPTLRYAETAKRGYLVLTLSPTEARSDWIQVSTAFLHSYSSSTAGSRRTLPGAANRAVIGV